VERHGTVNRQRPLGQAATFLLVESDREGLFSPHTPG
jgi:hypothetical protein